MKKKRKGFTLIELLAVIVILGLLMAIAIPSVTKYITESRKKTLTTTLGNYIGALVNEVNDLAYTFTGTNTIYAVPIECISLERGGTDPFGHWYQANNAYFAYVLVQYDDTTSKYVYGFTFKDSAGYGLYPTIQANINEKGSQIKTGYDLNKPKTGELTSLTTLAKWQESGFKLDSTTHLQVLVSESDGQTGNGTSTCTLQQKGDNYSQVEEEKQAELEASEGTEGTLNYIRAVNMNNVFGHDLAKSSIESIEFLDHKKVPANAIEWWDASVEQNKSIKAWILDSDNDEKYELYIGQIGGITAPKDSSYLLSFFTAAEKIDAEKLNVSNVENFSYMFSFCGKVNTLKISSWDTSNATSMFSMFSLMQGMTSLDLRHFNTSKVTTMQAMFTQSYFESINVSSFDTSNVTSMYAMFYASEIKSINLSNFNTSKVTSMGRMFASCHNLTSLDLSSFNTSNVTDMSEMFEFARNLNSLNLGNNFNTSKATNMSEMFYDTPKLKTTITLRNPNANYDYFLDGSASDSSARVYLNYTSSTLSAVNAILSEKISSARIYKGSKVS